MTTETQVITLDELNNSKSYVKEKSNLTIHSKDLLRPILDLDFIKHGIEAPQISVSHELINVNDDKTENVAFGRVVLLSKVPINEELTYKVGAILAMDLSTPMLKVFSGTHVNACTNLNIFGGENIQKFDVFNLNGAAEAMKKMIENKEQEIAKHLEKIELMKETYLTRAKVFEFLGKLISYPNRIFGNQQICIAAEMLADKKSIYFVPTKKNQLTSVWNVYNAFTQVITDRSHIFDAPNKSVFVAELFDEFLKPANNLLLGEKTEAAPEAEEETNS